MAATPVEGSFDKAQLPLVLSMHHLVGNETALSDINVDDLDIAHIFGEYFKTLGMS